MEEPSWLQSGALPVFNFNLLILGAHTSKPMSIKIYKAKIQISGFVS